MKAIICRYLQEQFLKKVWFPLLLVTNFIAVISFNGCISTPEPQPPKNSMETYQDSVVSIPKTFHLVKNDVAMRGYLTYIDSLVEAYKSLTSGLLDEYVIIHANSWIIDSLAAQDYYNMKKRGIEVKEPADLIILKEGDELLIPDSSLAQELFGYLMSVHLEVNIPEFILRIKFHDSTAYAFPVRVGKNERKYLAMAGKVIDLKTRMGKGTIVRVNKQPLYINPSNNKRYYSTRRDDGQVTGLPLVPWIEPELDGQRYGQLIHPTTNPVTLGKAYSNGCIGVAESAMWYIYYHSRIGTEITVTYDLNVVNETGNSVILQDIYPSYNRLWANSISKSPIIKERDFDPLTCCDCGESYE